MATMKTNSEAYYAHKLAAIERRRKFWGNLPWTLLNFVLGVLIVVWVVLVGRVAVYMPIKEHNDWVEKVDRDLAELKSRPPVVQTIIREIERPTPIRIEFPPCYVTNIVTPTTIFWTNRDMSDFTHFTPQVTFPTNRTPREVTNVMLRGF